MPTNQNRPTASTPPATSTVSGGPTAAQKIVAAMWTLGHPATAKTIAQAAAVGYSTATPILRNLVATNQAIKTDNATGGPAEWQLTATLPTTGQPAPDLPAPGQPISDSPTPTHAETGQSEPPVLTSPAQGSPSAAAPADEEPPTAPDPADDTTTHGAHTDPDHGDINTDSNDDPDDDADDHPGDDERDADGSPHRDPEPDGTGASTVVAASSAEPGDSGDASDAAKRRYRKPAQPRRPKGQLRAAVLAVLTAAPHQQFKVSDVCKAIDAANTDGAVNKAGPGAVVNALDKLVGSGDAIHLDGVKPAIYQAAP